ncbi:MAG: YcxB family protein [Dehalococcoidales bacterium]|nr:YcxB family protein [Dehalococcoidales bacterium]
MEVVFDMNLVDIVEFNLFNLKHHPQLKKRLAIMRIAVYTLAAVMVILGLISRFILDNSSIGILLLVLGIGLLVYFLWQNNSNRTRKRIIQAVRRQYKKIPNEEICRHRVSLSEEGYRVITDYRDNKTPWSEFAQIVQTNDYLYLFLNIDKSFIVPRRAFRDVAGYNSFAEKAIKYFENNRK